MNLALYSLLETAGKSIEIERGRVRVLSEPDLRSHAIDVLAQAAVFGAGEQPMLARWLIWETAQTLGIRPASIHELYVARGYDRLPTRFTVPAFNIRALAYDSARAAFAAALKAKTGAMIFELARSEMAYTDQRPAEYASVILAAAIKEGFRGLVFLQGDHFQVLLDRYLRNTDEELGALRHLVDESLKAGFYNFDIDTSTVVKRDVPELREQQRSSYELMAVLTDYIRTHQPAHVIPAIGGEISEHSRKKSDIHELRAFMDGYRAAIHHHPGLSKIAVHAGTLQGGLVLPNGSVAAMEVDFARLHELSEAARTEYGTGGVVQHGASTLPDDVFSRFVQAGAIEVHLGTGLQNIVFDNLPPPLADDMRVWVFEHLAAERKAGDTDEQFFYKTRKKALGPFKQQLWSLSDFERAQIRAVLEARFALLFKRLGVEHTRDMVATFVSMPETHKTAQEFGAASGPIAATEEEAGES